MPEEIVQQPRVATKKNVTQSGDDARQKRTQNEKKPQRGALLVTFKPSTPTLPAGSSFSISVTITNPFEVPVQIKSVSTLLPVDLYDVNIMVRQKEQKKAKKELDKIRSQIVKQLGVEEEKVPPPTGLEIGKDFVSEAAKAAFGLIPLGGLFVNVLDIITSKFIEPQISGSAVAIYSPKIETQEKRIFLPKDQPIDTWKAVEEMLNDINNKQKQQKVQTLLLPLEEEFQKKFLLNETSAIEIQPGDSITNVFVLRTKKGITFTPTSFSLDVTVQYDVDLTTHNQTIPYILDIQAAQSSVIIGAVVGSIFGVVVTEIKSLFDGQWLTVLPRIITTMIISAFAVIAFARKAGVQPIIAVQDIWGGLLVGFLVGYSGTQVLGNLFSGTDPAAIVGATPTPIP